MILFCTTLLAVGDAALAWTGPAVAYPSFPRGAAGFRHTPYMPARAQPVAYRYPAYPAYPHPPSAPAREAAARPQRRMAQRTPAAAVKHSKPARQEQAATPADTTPSAGSHKQRFFDKLLPLVTRENARLLELRGQLSELQADRERGSPLTASRQQWLRGLAEEYRIATPGDGDVLLEALLERVDAIPAGLALAQAANESAWGTSRFAREGNNLFGTWTWDADKGIKPKRRAAGKTHLVRSYDSLAESVRDYMHNLNSHPAYQPLRVRRAALRADRQPLSAVNLAEGLSAYAENGEVYVELIQSMIRSNKLEGIAQLQVADAGQPPG